MNILIFAGGAGTRLWPLSRRNSPKQFEKIIENKSTLQLAIERVADFGYENIYISTNASYKKILEEQTEGKIPQENILLEPARRDLAAAVGLTLFRLRKNGKKGTVAILWADHLMKNVSEFVTSLKRAEELIHENPERFVFLAEKPRFANHNLGWIHIGKKTNENVFEFLGWKYRPDLLLCEKMFASGNWMWNPGYFVCDLDFVLSLYQKFMPEMYSALEVMVENEDRIQTEYEKLPSLSFDNAIVEKVSPTQAVVLKVDMGWSDPGTLYAMKEALVVEEKENFIKGSVEQLDSRDCFLYNSEEKKILTTIGLEGMIVVNTDDAILVCHKTDVPRLKELLQKMEENDKQEYL